ncbi:DUF2520 domain-containing protein [Leucobacter sp. HY1908]
MSETTRILIVGGGRMGRALAHALPGAQLEGRGATGLLAADASSSCASEGVSSSSCASEGISSSSCASEASRRIHADLVLLAVPDQAIAAAAKLIVPGPIVAHLSGATGLDVLGEREAFSLHPLLAVTGPGTTFAGAYAAVDGTSQHALAAAEALAAMLKLRTFRVASADRVAYHAAASVAANFLVTVEDFAARLAATAGVPRDALVPLAQAALDGWVRDGAAALTGPISRGDEATVAAQRAAVAERVSGAHVPGELNTQPSTTEPLATGALSSTDLQLFDALTAATRVMAGRDPRPDPKETTA